MSPPCRVSLNSISPQFLTCQQLNVKIFNINIKAVLVCHKTTFSVSFLCLLFVQFFQFHFILSLTQNFKLDHYFLSKTKSLLFSMAANQKYSQLIFDQTKPKFNAAGRIFTCRKNKWNFNPFKHHGFEQCIHYIISSVRIIISINSWIIFKIVLGGCLHTLQVPTLFRNLNFLLVFYNRNKQMPCTKMSFSFFFSWPI